MAEFVESTPPFEQTPLTKSLSEIEQRTAEWHALRLGKATGSRIADAVAKTKSGQPSASVQRYLIELVQERLTGQRAEMFVTRDMQHGIDQEPNARAAYERKKKVTVKEVGFVPHPDIKMSGASPDGLVGKYGLVEIKCPRTATMIEMVLSQEIPLKYQIQMQWQMACTGRRWCDFVVYDPRLPEKSNLWVQKLKRDADMIAQLERDISIFLEFVEEGCAEFIEIVK